MDNSTNEEHLSQPLQTINKQFKVAVSFLSGYNGIYNVTKENNKFTFISKFEGVEFDVVNIPPVAYEIESLGEEIERIFIEEGYITEGDYPFKIKPNFNTLCRIIEIMPGRGWQISFVQDDSLSNFLGFTAKLIHEEKILSD